MHVNKVSHVKTVDLVAKELGENVDLLHEVALDMDVEDGVIWVYDLDDDGVLAFTDFGVETLVESDQGPKRISLIADMRDGTPAAYAGCVR